MRLLHAKELKLTDFIGDPPEYVILSHTWEEEEIIYPDVQRHEFQHKKSFPKLAGCCAKALEDGYEWVWVDTCCIDKTSSAELSEAINSMYQWYQRANVCYAYLSDLETRDNDVETLKKCRWFTRGWTLQELIAPEFVEFYDRNWNEIGTKMSMKSQIAQITGIRMSILDRTKSTQDCNVGERLSWAAPRMTTRPEDRAYSLLGVFGINIPLLYGEGGEKAFRRLQEEILKKTSDHTMFIHHGPLQSIVAPSVSCFQTPFWAKVYSGKSYDPQETNDVVKPEPIEYSSLIAGRATASIGNNISGRVTTLQLITGILKRKTFLNVEVPDSAPQGRKRRVGINLVPIPGQNGLYCRAPGDFYYVEAPESTAAASVTYIRDEETVYTPSLPELLPLKMDQAEWVHHSFEKHAILYRSIPFESMGGLRELSSRFTSLLVHEHNGSLFGLAVVCRYPGFFVIQWNEKNGIEGAKAQFREIRDNWIEKTQSLVFGSQPVLLNCGHKARFEFRRKRFDRIQPEIILE